MFEFSDTAERAECKDHCPSEEILRETFREICFEKSFSLILIVPLKGEANSNFGLTVLIAIHGATIVELFIYSCVIKD